MLDRTDDAILVCDLNRLYTIYAGSIHPPCVELTASCFTICAWIRAASSAATQVIVNWGHRHAGEPGWSCFLHEGCLVVSMCSMPDIHAAISRLYPDDGLWHHLVVCFNTEAMMIAATLDGTDAGWFPSLVRLQPQAPVGGQPGLAIGGYTDAAGGHFDYTFGRNGTGYIDDLRIYDRKLDTDEIAAFLPAPGPSLSVCIAWQSPHCNAPVRVRFHAIPPPPCGTALLWTWPDGRRTLGHTVEHDFAYAGQNLVQLDVIDANHRQASTSAAIVLVGAENPLQVTTVFSNGEDGYTAYRIPSIVRAQNGDLVAFAEGRVESVSDATATIRIVSKVSRDNGRTWSRLCVVGRNLVAGIEFAAMNASPVVDTIRGSGRIVLLFKKLERSEWEIAQGQGLMRTFCILSDDHGMTWHSERDITGQVHRPYQPNEILLCPAAALAENRKHDWRIQVPTLGHAIQLRGTSTAPATQGRLFYIGSRTRNNDSVFASMNYAFWSDNLGENWQIGDSIAVRSDGTPAIGLNEATAVELSDGRVMVNSRNYQDGQPVHLRAVTVGSFDAQGRLVFGQTRHDSALIEPAVHASLLRCTWPDQPGAGGRSRIVFANPAHPRDRINMTVRLSYDEGVTWPVAKVIDPGPSAYCDLVMQQDGSIGLLYERGNSGGIVYASFPLSWLTDGKDRMGDAAIG